MFALDFLFNNSRLLLVLRILDSAFFVCCTVISLVLCLTGNSSLVFIFAVASLHVFLRMSV